MGKVQITTCDGCGQVYDSDNDHLRLPTNPMFPRAGWLGVTLSIEAADRLGDIDGADVCSIECLAVVALRWRELTVPPAVDEMEVAFLAPAASKAPARKPRAPRNVP